MELWLPRVCMPPDETRSEGWVSRTFLASFFYPCWCSILRASRRARIVLLRHGWQFPTAVGLLTRPVNAELRHDQVDTMEIAIPEGCPIVAEKGHDGDELRERIEERGNLHWMPARRGRKEPSSHHNGH